MCPEAGLAARLTSAGLAEARMVLAGLRRVGLDELDPDPGEGSVPVDEKPNPFSAAPLADRYLRGLPSGGDVAHLSLPRPSPLERHANYVVARMVRVVGKAGAEAGLVVFGRGDGLGDGERAEHIRALLANRQPFAAIDPVDGVTSLLTVSGEGWHAAAAIVVRSPRHVAFSVGSGSTVAVGSHGDVVVRFGDGDWVQAGQLKQMPVLAGSVLAPLNGDDTLPVVPWQQQTGTVFGEAGNAMLLNGIVLGGVEAGFQPACRPWEAAAVYLAAAVGRKVARADTGRFFTHPHQVQALLINSLLAGEQVPGLITARDELAGRRLLTYLRKGGIA